MHWFLKVAFACRFNSYVNSQSVDLHEGQNRWKSRRGFFKQFKNNGSGSLFLSSINRWSLSLTAASWKVVLMLPKSLRVGWCGPWWERGRDCVESRRVFFSAHCHVVWGLNNCRMNAKLHRHSAPCVLLCLIKPRMSQWDRHMCVKP